MSKVEIKKKAVAKGVTAWSFSRLTKYEDCPRRFKLNVIDGFKEPGSQAMDRGKEIHLLGEQYLKGLSAELPEIYKLLAVEMGAARDCNAESELEVTFTKDWKLTGWFDDNAWCRIKIDVLILDTTVVRLIDLKTGKNRGGYEDQLELYALAALLMYPEVDNVIAELWFIDSGEFIGTSHGAYTQKDVKVLKKKWEKRVKPMFIDDLWSPRPNQYCKYCTFTKSKGGQCEY
jgi:hypothetical protein